VRYARKAALVRGNLEALQGRIKHKLRVGGFFTADQFFPRKSGPRRDELVDGSVGTSLAIAPVSKRLPDVRADPCLTFGDVQQHARVGWVVFTPIRLDP